MPLDLSFPRRPYVEFFIENRWQNVISDIRAASGIKIKRGRENEQGENVPAVVNFTLDDGPEHGNGKYSPRNAKSPWFGKLLNNVPTRLGLEIGKDSFDRTVGAGWGTSPQNGNWSFSGTANTSSSVSGGVGIHSVNAADEKCFNYISDILVKDIDVSVTVTLSDANLTGAHASTGIIFRGTSVTDFYIAALVINPDETVQIWLLSDESTFATGAVTLPYTYTGQSWRIRMNMEQGHMMAKAWPAASNEPLAWQIGTIRSTPRGAGFVGIRSTVALGNTDTKPILFQYDDLEFRKPRATVEGASFKPKSSLNHKLRTVDVECGGPLRRILRYKKSLNSAPQRFIERLPNVTQYWPLEDDPLDTTLGKNLKGGPSVRFARTGGTSGTIEWGKTDNVPASIKAAPEITASGMLVFAVPRASTNSTGYTFSWGQCISAQASARQFFRMAGTTGIEVRTYTTGLVEIYNLATGVLDSNFTLADMGLGYDNVWHACTMDIRANGGSLDYFVYFDNIGVGGTMAQACTPLREVSFLTGVDTSAGSRYSHAFVSNSLGSSFTHSDWFEAFFGYGSFSVQSARLGEDFLNRFIRICSEEGIQYSYVGQTFEFEGMALMGPQTPNLVGQLLLECADVKSSTFWECRSLPAVSIRNVTRIYDQTPTVTLDYSAEHIFPEFEPVDDDLEPVNDVTAKSIYGATEFRYERLTGAMNVNDPGTVAGAIGRYDAQVDVNADRDVNYPPVAEWRVHLGTINEPRYPELTVHLGAKNITNQIASDLLDVNIDDMLAINSLQNTLIYDSVRQLTRGYVENLLGQYEHLITFNLSPASPYDTFKLDSSDQFLDDDFTTINEDLDTTETGIDIIISNGGTPWTIAFGQFNIFINGEKMTVTNVTGTGPTQTLTVVRSVNGVVRTHTTGDSVHVADAFYLRIGVGS